jgi:hypothetical protein
MSWDSSYLKYLIDEEIYFIGETRQEDIAEPESEKKPEIPQGQPPVFHNKTLIFLEYPKKQGLPETSNDFLSKILKAVHLDIRKVELVFSEEKNVIYVNNLTGCKIIAFLSKIPDQFSGLENSERYIIHALHKNQLVLCDPLEAIQDDKDLKRKLWNQLKILYSI